MQLQPLPLHSLNVPQVRSSSLQHANKKLHQVNQVQGNLALSKRLVHNLVVSPGFFWESHLSEDLVKLLQQGIGTSTRTRHSVGVGRWQCNQAGIESSCVAQACMSLTNIIYLVPNMDTADKP